MSARTTFLLAFPSGQSRKDVNCRKVPGIRDLNELYISGLVKVLTRGHALHVLWMIWFVASRHPFVVKCCNVLKWFRFFFCRFPEAPQAAVEQCQEVPGPQAQARVRSRSARSPAQGGPSRPNQLQADQLGLHHQTHAELNAISNMDQSQFGQLQNPSFVRFRSCLILNSGSSILCKVVMA